MYIMKKLALFNAGSVVLAVAMGYLGNALELNGNSIGSLSDEYGALFTPAGYAFSIWGLIYLGLFGYSYHQLKESFAGRKPAYLLKSGPWFFLANLANAAWVPIWLYEFTGLSVLIMGVILFSLLMVIFRTDMEMWNPSLKTFLFVWWPICIYTGWITVAFLTNVAVYMKKMNLEDWLLTEVQWTIFFILLAGLLNIAAVVYRNLREFGLVGVWALVAIFIKHFSSRDDIAFTALISAVLVLGVIGWHAYRNRQTHPFRRVIKSKS